MVNFPLHRSIANEKSLSYLLHPKVVGIESEAPCGNSIIVFCVPWEKRPIFWRPGVSNGINRSTGRLRP
jgi:hypothetical protein